MEQGESRKDHAKNLKSKVHMMLISKDTYDYLLLRTVIKTLEKPDKVLLFLSSKIPIKQNVLEPLIEEFPKGITKVIELDTSSFTNGYLKVHETIRETTQQEGDIEFLFYLTELSIAHLATLYCLITQGHSYKIVYASRPEMKVMKLPLVKDLSSEHLLILELLKNLKADSHPVLLRELLMEFTRKVSTESLQKEEKISQRKVSHYLDKLESLGWIKKENNPQDKRMKLISLMVH